MTANDLLVAAVALLVRLVVFWEWDWPFTEPLPEARTVRR